MADFLKRTLELTAVLARATAARSAGRLAEARTEVSEAAARLCGVDLGLVEALGPAAIAGHLDGPRREALASLCEARAEVEVAAGDAPGAGRWRSHARAFRGGA